MGKTIYKLSFLYGYILDLSSEDKEIVESDKTDIYEEYTIEKHGKKRKVYTLSGENGSILASIQRKLTKNYLTKLDLPYPVKGFIKGESYKTFLCEHIGNEHFLRLDIKSFFQSINIEKFNKEFMNIIKINDEEEKGDAMKLIENICFYNDSLPQGACSSPAMSNIIFSRVDQRILKYCQKLNVRYTRYADDLLFSSQNLEFKKSKWFTNKIQYILHDVGYKLNYKKTLYSVKGQLNLNGYILNAVEVRLSRKRFRHIYSIINTVNNVLNINDDYEKCKKYIVELIFNEKMIKNKYIYYCLHKENSKIKGIKFYYLENDINYNFSNIKYKYFFIDRIILAVIKLSIKNNGRYILDIDKDKLIFYENKGNWKYPKYRFTSMNAIVEYLLGQRSYLISWISEEDSFNQRRIKKVISLIEDSVDKIDKIYI